MSKLLLSAIVACLLAGTFACSDSAKTMYESARFEELQHNPEHAAELYEEIVNKYPESDYAAKAGQRLKAIRQDER